MLRALLTLPSLYNTRTHFVSQRILNDVYYSADTSLLYRCTVTGVCIAIGVNIGSPARRLMHA